MIGILVPIKRTFRQITREELKRDEFRPSRYTSGCANLDDMVACGKAVILCLDHYRKFSPKHAKYRAHPDANLRRVFGRCDWCQSEGLSFLFLNEPQAYEEQKKLERYKRSLEYAHIFRG